MDHRTARLALAVVSGAASLLLATPADAGTASCTTTYIDIPSLNFNVGGAFDCTMNNVGTCTFVFDPLFNFPNHIAPEAIEYANCLA